MSFSKRLSALMTQKGVSDGELARKVGISRQSVSYWRLGRNEPSPSTLARAAEILGTTPLWLKTGEDDIHGAPVTVSEEVEKNEDFVFVPEYRLSFGCSPEGRDAPEWTPIPEEATAYRLSFFQSRGIRPDKCKRIVAEGDSMEPLICDGDKVLIVDQPEGAPIRDGKIYAISYGGALKIKRLYRKANGDLIISSLNPKYPDEIVSNSELNDLIRVHGLVIERCGSV